MEREATGEWRCGQSVGGGLVEHESSSKLCREVNWHREKKCWGKEQQGRDVAGIHLAVMKEREVKTQGPYSQVDMDYKREVLQQTSVGVMDMQTEKGVKDHAHD